MLLVYHADGKEYFDVKCHKPKAYQAPLLGREYHHGVQDCYSLVRDYYHRELDIHLPDFHRTDGWWEKEHHLPLYENNFTKAGFIKMQDETDLQKHDVILCRVGRTHHVNHALIYVGDGKLKSETTPDCVGNALILHHPMAVLACVRFMGTIGKDARRWWCVIKHQTKPTCNCLPNLAKALARVSILVVCDKSTRRVRLCGTMPILLASSAWLTFWAIISLSSNTFTHTDGGKLTKCSPSCA